MRRHYLITAAAIGLVLVAVFSLGTSLVRALAVNRANHTLAANLLAAGAPAADGCAYDARGQALNGNRLALAGSDWQRVSGIWPGVRGWQRQEALLSLLGGDWERARTSLEQAQDPVSRLRSAWLAAGEGRTSDSAGDLAAAYANPFPVLMLRGLQAFEAQNYQTALDCFQVAAALQPADAEAVVWRGRAHHMLGQPQAALADFDQGIALCSACFQYHLYRGYLRYELGQVAEAGDDFARALELAPDVYGVVLQWAFWQQTIGRLEEAEAPFLKAIALEPDQLEPVLALAGLYCQMDQTERASSLLEAAQARFPASAEAIDKQMRACP